MEEISTEDKKDLTAAEVLQHIGEYGRFQCFLDIFFSIITIPVGIQVLIVKFLAVDPTWRCKENSTTCTFNGTLNADDRRKCILPRDSWEYIEGKDFSLITQFDIQCENEWLLMLLLSTVFVGWGVGAVIIGSIADNFGRKIVIFPSFAMIILIGFASSFLTNIYLFVACRFIIGFFVPGTTVQGMILLSEIVGNRQRPLACLIITLGYPIGFLLLSSQAYLVQNWRVLSIICTVPYSVMLLFYKFVPDSVLWLSVRGKTKEVTDIFSKIAKWNKTVLPANITIVSREEATTRRTNPLDIFRTRKLAVYSIALAYSWAVTSMSYNGMYMAADKLGGSLYRDFTLISLIDIPGVLLCMYICNRFGRKSCVLLPLSIGGILCIAIGLTPYTNDYYKVLRVVLGNVGNFLLCMSFNGLFAWSVEIYPTAIRSTGIGFAMVASRVGAITAPLVVNGLAPIGEWCPFVALGIPALFGYFIGQLLPETKEKNVEPIIENMEENVVDECL